MTNEFQNKLMAGLAAAAVTLTLLVSSFANPNATSVVGLLA
ncbi:MULTISPECIES: hypothetical protein [Erythrobacteraceae]|uniref:Uncharacterized protein n=1 Tax=Erythrobacter westpacificensis TaxID=1055231 RepID=A0ABP9KP75_9SPHN|nr:hypothetical protein [Aurantiacibacter odishensis]|tara:strand:- start:225 stop:347 length:123 start_codon:yes stop_codon:yes gene_type:complete